MWFCIFRLVPLGQSLSSLRNWILYIHHNPISLPVPTINALVSVWDRYIIHFVQIKIANIHKRQLSYKRRENDTKWDSGVYSFLADVDINRIGNLSVLKDYRAYVYIHSFPTAPINQRKRDIEWIYALFSVSNTGTDKKSLCFLSLQSYRFNNTMNIK